MGKARKSEFKKRLEQIQNDHGPVERDFWFWLEHALHWNFALLAFVMILTFAYLLFDKNAPAWASIVPTN